MKLPSWQESALEHLSYPLCFRNVDPPNTATDDAETLYKLQIKAVIQQFVTSKDVNAFARQLATAVCGSSRGQAAVPALAAIVSRSKRDDFTTQLKVC